jgi:hypothetical protein
MVIESQNPIRPVLTIHFNYPNLVPTRFFPQVSQTSAGLTKNTRILWFFYLCKFAIHPIEKLHNKVISVKKSQIYSDLFHPTPD